MSSYSLTLSLSRTDSPSHIPLPPTSGDDLYGTLRRAFDVEISLNPLQENIRRHLYRTSFQRFVRSMLIEENRVKLGAFQDEDDDYAGLGDCFCLTNPRAGTENREYEIARDSDASTCY